MATKQFKIDLSVDSSGRRDLQALENSLKQTAESINELERKRDAIEEAFKGVRFGTEEYKLLASELQKVNSELSNIDESVTDITSGEKVEGFVRFGSAIGAVATTTATLTSAFGEQNEELEESLLKLTALVTILETLQIITEAVGKENKFFTQFLARNTVATQRNTAATEANTAAAAANAATSNALGQSNNALEQSNDALSGSFGRLSSSFRSLTSLSRGWVGVIVGLITALGIVASNFTKVRAIIRDLTKTFNDVVDSITDFLGITTEASRETAKLVKNLRNLEEVQKLVFSNELLKKQEEYLKGIIFNVTYLQEEAKEIEKRLKLEKDLAKAEKDKLNNSVRYNEILEDIRKIRVEDGRLSEKIDKQKNLSDKLNINQLNFIAKLEKEKAENLKNLSRLQIELATIQKDALEAEQKALETNNELLDKQNEILERQIEIRKSVLEGIEATYEFELENVEKIDILETNNLERRIGLINALYKTKREGVLEELKNNTLTLAETQRLNNELVSLEREKNRKIKETKDLYLTESISFERQLFNQSFSKSLDELNRQLAKSNNISERANLKTQINEIKTSQLLLNEASKVEVKNKNKLLELTKEYNKLLLQRDALNQGDISKIDEQIKKRQEELEFLKRNFEIYKNNIKSGANDLRDFFTSGTDVADFFKFPEIVKEIDKFLAGGSLKILAEKLQDVQNDAKSLAQTKPNFFGVLGADEFNDLIKIVDKFASDTTKFQFDKIRKLIVDLEDEKRKLLKESDIGDTDVDAEIKRIEKAIIDLSETTGLSKKAVEEFIDSKDKITASNDLEQQLIEENRLLELQRAFLGALQVEILKFDTQRDIIGNYVKDIFALEGIDIDDLLAGKLTRKELNKTNKELKGIVRSTVSELNMVLEEELVKLQAKQELEKKLIDSQIELLSRKINQEVFNTKREFKDLTDFIAQNVDLGDLDKETLRETFSELNLLTSEQIDLLLEYVNLQIQRKQNEEDYKKSVEETTDKVEEQQNSLKKLIKLSFEDVASTSINIFNSFTDIFELFIEAALNNFDIAFENLQSKLDLINEEISKTQEKISNAENELRNSSGARRKQILEDLDAERIRLLELQKQRDENETKQAEIDKKRIQAEKTLQGVLSITNTLEQTALAIQAIKSVFTDVTTPSIILKLAAVAATVGAITSAVTTIKSFESGGLLEGRSHAEGGIRGTGEFNNIEVEGGEFIVNKKSTRKYLPLLEKINKDKYANGGVLPELNTDKNILYKIAELESRMIDLSERPIYVSVTDINDENNKLTKVTKLTTL